MSIFNLTGYALSTSVALTVLAGCSGGGSPMPAPPGQVSGVGTQPAEWQGVEDLRFNRILALRRGIISGHRGTSSFMNPAAVGRPLLFISAGYNLIDIYLQGGKQKMMGQITGLSPAGLATDSSRNLYVANYSASAGGSIPVYAPPYTGSPTITLNDAGYSPQGVAVSPQGVVGVANFCNASCASGSGNVVLYAHNSTTPCATIADPKFQLMEYDAFDRNGNLYVDAFGGSGVMFGEITGGCNAKNITLLTATNTLSLPFGIQVDKHNRVAILNDGGSTYDVLDIYKVPKGGSLGSPISVVDLVTPAYPTDFAFSASNADVYTAEGQSCASQCGGGLANTYDFPVGGTFEKSIPLGASEAGNGAAVTPASVP
jgi:hypothetical protein